MPAWLIDMMPNQNGDVLATAGLVATMSVIATGTSAWSCSDLKPGGTSTRSPVTMRWSRTDDS